jgi:hypothetical protein
MNKFKAKTLNKFITINLYLKNVKRKKSSNKLFLIQHLV